MKKETKKIVAAVAAGFGLVTLIGTVVLVTMEHPAQWWVAGVCLAAMAFGLFVGCSIED